MYFSVTNKKIIFILKKKKRNCVAKMKKKKDISFVRNRNQESEDTKPLLLQKNKQTKPKTHIYTEALKRL